jgi:hypothetical protein
MTDKPETPAAATLPDEIQIGPLIFERTGGSGMGVSTEHEQIGYAESVYDEVWAAFVAAARIATPSVSTGATAKNRLRVTWVGEYPVEDTANYGSDDPVEMAKVDQRSIDDGQVDVGDFLSFADSVSLTVEPAPKR